MYYNIKVYPVTVSKVGSTNQEIMSRIGESR